MHSDFSPLLIRVDDIWYVNDVLGKEWGWLQAKVVVEEDEQAPPVKGWKYRKGWKWRMEYRPGDKYQSDQTLVCSREITPGCSEIIVELKGKAKKIVKVGDGSYFPVEGKFNRGRQVGSLYHLLVAFVTATLCV